jgi:peptidoglycan/LPS O-acetylase OafA/YrhL
MAVLAGAPHLVAVAVAFILTCVLCELIHRLIERPAARLRRRLGR